MNETHQTISTHGIGTRRAREWLSDPGVTNQGLKRSEHPKTLRGRGKYGLCNTYSKLSTTYIARMFEWHNGMYGIIQRAVPLGTFYILLLAVRKVLSSTAVITCQPRRLAQCVPPRLLVAFCSSSAVSLARCRSALGYVAAGVVRLLSSSAPC